MLLIHRSPFLALSESFTPWSSAIHPPSLIIGAGFSSPYSTLECAKYDARPAISDFHLRQPSGPVPWALIHCIPKIDPASRFGRVSHHSTGRGCRFLVTSYYYHHHQLGLTTTTGRLSSPGIGRALRRYRALGFTTVLRSLGGWEVRTNGVDKRGCREYASLQPKAKAGGCLIRSLFVSSVGDSESHLVLNIVGKKWEVIQRV
jgi:hypothetical protein